jgi:membrane dipeptidase
VLIIDAHLDLAWNALHNDRDVTRAVRDIRAQENGIQMPNRGLATVGLPDLQRGRVAVVVGTVFARCTGKPAADLDFHTPQHCHAAGRGQLEFYRALDEAGIIRMITTAASLAEHLALWRRQEAEVMRETPVPGLIVSIECADPLTEPEALNDWHAAGVRLLGLSHYGLCRYAGGTNSKDGLTDRGRRLLKVMAELNMPLDLSHTSDPSFDEAVRSFDGPIFASHNNCRTLVPKQRQFANDQLQTIIDRDGVVGTVFDCWMLKPGWTRQDGNNGVTLTTVVDHIDHVCQLAGNSRHAAIGSDLDGGFGQEQSPADLDTIADLQKIVGILEDRGYASEDIANIMHGNWERLFLRVLP